MGSTVGGTSVAWRLPLAVDPTRHGTKEAPDLSAELAALNELEAQLADAVSKDAGPLYLAVRRVKRRIMPSRIR
jgi:hypothetical protein